MNFFILSVEAGLDLAVLQLNAVYARIEHKNTLQIFNAESQLKIQYMRNFYYIMATMNDYHWFTLRSTYSFFRFWHHQKKKNQFALATNITNTEIT